MLVSGWDIGFFWSILGSISGLVSSSGLGFIIILDLKQHVGRAGSSQIKSASAPFTSSHWSDGTQLRKKNPGKHW